MGVIELRGVRVTIVWGLGSRVWSARAPGSLSWFGGFRVKGLLLYRVWGVGVRGGRFRV